MKRREFSVDEFAARAVRLCSSVKMNQKLFKRQSAVEAPPDTELHLLIDWWLEKGKREKPEKRGDAVKWLVEQLDDISRDSNQKENLFSFTNDHEQTALHLSILHRLPEEFIIALVLKMEKSELDQQDVNGYRAIDYLFDWPKVNVAVLQAFMKGEADIIMGRTSPVIRFCRRPTDGHELLKSVFANDIVYFSWNIKTRMLEEAIKRGSSKSVELLLKGGADPGACNRFLLFEAAEANHDSVEKVGLLLDDELDPSQYNKAGQTLVHIAAGAKPPRLDLLDLALKIGIDPNKQDKKGDTALHKVTKNYAERTVPWCASEQAMIRLLRRDKIDLNVKNAKKKTPLHNLVAAKYLSPRLILMWQARGASFVQEEALLDSPLAKEEALLDSPLAKEEALLDSPLAKEEALLDSPLADLCRRRDGPQLFKYVSSKLNEGTTDWSKSIKYLLQAAVVDGTAEMVKELLDLKANANESKGLLLMMAACSKIDADLKIRYLYEGGARYTYEDSRGYSVLHSAAQSETWTKKVVRVCTNKSYLNLKLKQRDRYQNTPLHIAAMSKKDGSDVLVGCLADKDQGGDPNAVNRDGKTAFRLVLKHNYDKKELRRNKLMILLERGCLPTRRDFDEYKGNVNDFQNLFLSSELVARSHNPLQLLLVLGWYCNNPLPDVGSLQLPQSSDRASSEWARTDKWENLSAKFEEEAVMIMNEFGKKTIFRKVMTNTDIQEVREMKWEKFLSNKHVGKMLNQMFYGRVDAFTAEESSDEMEPNERKTWYRLPFFTVLFLLQSLLLPFYLLKSFFAADGKHKREDGEYKSTDGENKIKRKLHELLFADPEKRPVVTVCGYIFSYLIFLGFVIAHIVKEDTENAFTWNEWIIVLYVVSLLLDEINQAYQAYQAYREYRKYQAYREYRKCQTYRKNRAKQAYQDYQDYQPYQAHSFALTYVTFTNMVDNFKILCYCTFLVLRVIGTSNGDLSALRAAEHVFAVAAMLSCLRLLYYLQVNWQLGPILISITEVTKIVLVFIGILGVVLVAFSVAISGVYGAGVYTTEFKNGSISLPPPVQGLWSSLQTMYWSLFGQINREDLTSEYDVLSLESAVGKILFAFWLLASVIVLLNILIALINEAFDGVKKQNADLVWNLAVSRVIVEVKSSPSLPLPMNIFFLVNNCILSLCTKGEETKDDPLLFTMPNFERILEAYQTTKHKHEKTEGGGLAHVQERLEEMTDLQWQTRRTHFKQMKRLEKRVRLLQVREVKHEDETDEHPPTDRENEADSDGDDEEMPTFRRRGVSCVDRKQLITISYEGKSGSVGGCLLLRNPMSLDRTYFEVLVDDYGKDGRIGIGFAHRDDSLSRMPGDGKHSIGYHCDNGRLLHAGNSVFKNEEGQDLAVPAQQGDVIGCGIKILSGSTDINDDSVVFFTRNGEEIGSLIAKLPKEGFFPIVGLCSEGAIVKVNLNVKWPSPDDEPSDVLLSESMLRIRDDCLSYDNRNRQLLYTAGLSQIEEHVGVFQDLSHPISRKLTYFEVRLLDMGVKGEIGIGVAHLQHPLHRMPGWSKGSTAYHCNDGNVFKGLSNKSTFARAERGDVIGCGMNVSATNSKRAQLFFTRNQILFEDFEMVLPADGLYPTVGMSTAGEEVQIDFDVKWPPQSSRTFSERIHTVVNVIEYIGDRFRRAGAYQSLASPMSREFSYYEVTIQDYGKEGRIGVGLARKDYPLNKQPGWLEGSVGWHCNDGDVFKDKKKFLTFRKQVKEGDVVGCGVDYKESQKQVNAERRAGRTTTAIELVVFFTLNGKRFDDVTVPMTEPKGGLFPIVGLQTLGETVEINLSPLALLQKSPDENADDKAHSLERQERVRIDSERGCVSYDVTACDFVGGLQYPKNMQQVKNYFEVSIVSPGDKRQIGIGIATEDFPLDHQPGWRDGSIGFLCDEGYRYRDGELVDKTIKWSLPQINDIIGCRIEPNNTVIFTHNGTKIGDPIQLNKKYIPSELFPTICLHSRGEAVKVNLDANWQSTGNCVFSRSERVRTEEQKVWYDSFDDTTIGAVQLKRKISKEHPYFEVEVDDEGRECAIGIGLARADYPLSCLPGWRPGSIGYHCQDGCLFEGKDIGQPIGEPVAKGDRIGCGIDYQHSTRDNALVYFTHDGKEVFKLKWSVPESDVGGVFYPTIGMSSKGETVKVIKDAKCNHPLSDSGVPLPRVVPLYQETSY